MLLAPDGVDPQTGQAELWEEEGNLVISIGVTPPGTSAQPTHLAHGDCERPRSISRTLQDTIGGKSRTLLPDLHIEDIANGDFVILLRASYADFRVTACGQITATD
jgi:hypothetical protein